jgi:hypothetical protein
VVVGVGVVKVVVDGGMDRVLRLSLVLVRVLGQVLPILASLILEPSLGFLRIVTERDRCDLHAVSSDRMIEK